MHFLAVKRDPMLGSSRQYFVLRPCVCDRNRRLFARLRVAAFRPYGSELEAGVGAAFGAAVAGAAEAAALLAGAGVEPEDCCAEDGSADASIRMPSGFQRSFLHSRFPRKLSFRGALD